MQTNLSQAGLKPTDRTVAEAIVRASVHCGFCNATCPTYQLLGDELDGPRGRIYQIKQVLEGASPTSSTQLHLDRCLTCRACETTCPSGVNYAQLLDIGRDVVEQRVQRPMRERVFRRLLREVLLRRRLFETALRVARSLAFALPGSLRAKIGAHRNPGAWPQRTHARRVLLLNGCTQPALSPAIDAATARVLDALGVQAIIEHRSGCCGALPHHLNDHAGALAAIRQNVDAWWPHVHTRDIEAIVINASGCGAMIKDYPHLLRDDPTYAAKAADIVGRTQDLAEFLGPQLSRLRERLRGGSSLTRIAFHPPCTLQHGLRIRGEVEKLLTTLGAQLVAVQESHLCCGSAGPYALLQPKLSRSLRDQKLKRLLDGQPEMILSANIGCLTHLEGGTHVPVRHWIEWVDAALGAQRG